MTRQHDKPQTQEAESKIQGRIDIKQDEFKTECKDIKGAHIFPDNTELTVCEPDESVAPLVDTSCTEAHRAGRWGKFWIFGLFAVIGLSAAELVLFIRYVFEQNDWLGGLWLVVLSVLLLLAVGELVKQFIGLRRLKKQEQNKRKAEHIYNSPAIGLGESFCLTLAKDLPSASQTMVAKWQTDIASHHNDKEVLALFELQVLVPADKAALKTITQHASAAGAMIAVSPFALLDMAIVLWRNFRMMNQISEAYGVSLSYWGRVSLVRNVFKTMLYAGASEIIADAGNYALGTGLAGKLSTRLAQGMSAGVLTARIGVKTMQECRPVPWLATKKPGISGITTQLLEDLKKLIP